MVDGSSLSLTSVTYCTDLVNAVTQKQRLCPVYTIRASTKDLGWVHVPVVKLLSWVRSQVFRNSGECNKLENKATSYFEISNVLDLRGGWGSVLDTRWWWTLFLAPIYCLSEICCFLEKNFSFQPWIILLFIDESISVMCLSGLHY